LFKNKFEDLKISYRSDFEFLLYNLLDKELINEKEKYFDFIDRYNGLRYNAESGFLYNIEEYFIKRVDEELLIKLKNANNNFSAEDRINRTIKMLTSKGIVVPNLFKVRKSFQALLLFNEEDEICKLIYSNTFENQDEQSKLDSNKIKYMGDFIDYDNYQILAEKVLDALDVSKLAFKSSKTMSVDDQQESHKLKKRKNKSRNLRFDTKDQEQVGFITELICYRMLVDKYGEKNISWVSENANRAFPDKFITSEAGKGYDLELTDDGKVRYIEIKGTSDVDDGIYMSMFEIKTALEFPDKYDLLIVENPLSTEPIIRLIKSPFLFSKGESLFSNANFKVFNEKYVIKFKWDE